LGAAGIHGTSSDAGSPVASIRIAVKDLSKEKWWNSINTNFTDPSGVPLFVSGVTGNPVLPDWNYPITSLGDNKLLSGASYYVTSEATDSGGNVETDYSSGSSTFTFDNTPPLTGVTRPSAGGVVSGGENYYKALPTLSGTADDFTMLPEIRLRRPKPKNRHPRFSPTSRGSEMGAGCHRCNGLGWCPAGVLL
jgi:hypothetical protein